jgi:ribosomal protein S12 methylthiotransferase accessory factor
MENVNIRPIVLGSVLVDTNKTIVSLVKNHVTIEVPSALMQELFLVCDGQKSLDQVIEILQSRWDRELLKSFFSHLVEIGVMQDSAAVSGFVWPFVANPTFFNRQVTDADVADMVERACVRHRDQGIKKFFEVEKFAFRKLICERKSTRSFSELPVKMEMVIQMLWSAYGIIPSLEKNESFDRHTVPSAGALYPLQVSLILLKPSNDFIAGVYKVGYSKNGLVGVEMVSDNLVPVYQAFADPLVLHNAGGVIVVSGSFAFTEEKYGNRALLYVPLEAGHVAQNVHLDEFLFPPFDVSKEYEWKEVEDLVTDERHYLLADCIYFPYNPGRPCLVNANSSGAAAYPTRMGAIEKGVLELVERDAFMIAWLNRLIMPTVIRESLPEFIQQRLRNLETAGFSVFIKDITLDLAPVILVFAQNKELHYTTCAASSDFNPLKALDHALMEVESSVHCRLVFGSSESIFPEDVRTTQDHGKLYEQEPFFHQADFFQESRLLRDINSVREGACLNWEALLSVFAKQGRSVFVVNLDGLGNEHGSSILHIVKTFVTGLVPMSFGYLEEPLGMQRIYEVPITLNFHSNPLRYDELNVFPHPYT